jgi:putative heme transporter
MPLFTTRRLVQTALVVFLLLGCIYFLFPKLVGLGDALSRLDEADPLWIAVAIGFNVIAYATYIALFKAVVGGDALRLKWMETYEINMAGVAATLLFSAGGAGGIALTYWALRKAGMRRRDVARRMVAFITLHYAFYPLALIVFGVLLRTGVLEGKSSVELTIIPAGVAGLLIVIGVLIALIPPDLERRLAPFAHGERARAFLKSAARVPATVGEGFRFAIGLFAHPSRGGLAVLGAAGFWAASIGVLWASFHAFGVHVPLAVVVQGFFLGMVANLFPLAPAGVGAVDAGMIGAFVLFGIPETTVFPAILVFRLVAFWMPIPPGIVAFFQLRKTVHGWETEGLPVTRGGSAESDLEPPTGELAADPVEGYYKK